MNIERALKEIIKNEVSNVLNEWSTTEALDRRFASYSEAKNAQDAERMRLAARKIAAWIHDAHEGTFQERLSDIQSFLEKNRPETELARKFLSARLNSTTPETSF